VAEQERVKSGLVSLAIEALEQVVVGQFPHALVEGDPTDQLQDRARYGLGHRAVPGERKRLSTYIVPSDARRRRFFFNFTHRSLGARRTHEYLSQVRYRKSLNVIRPHEEVEYVGVDYPLFKLLEKPNAWDTGPEMWFELDMYWDLTGNGYLWAPPSLYGRLTRTNQPAELWVIPSH
jgi:hypothetical protein